MSLTGIPQVALATPVERSIERVELMALLWQLLDGESAHCANPRLLMITRLLPELREEDAVQRLTLLRTTIGRDRLVKLLTSDAHGRSIDEQVHTFARSLDDLSDRWDGLLEGLAAPLLSAYRKMKDKAAAIVEGIDPVNDIEALTGEGDALATVISPSLFLPPPQNGRHSSLVEESDGSATGYLFYGFPLDEDPAAFGINAAWLLGGAWHYPVTRFIERHWLPISEALAQDEKLESALSSALTEHRETANYPAFVAEHLIMAIKCALCRKSGYPDLVHRSIARTQGAAFYDWFVEWVLSLSEAPSGFVQEFKRLPGTMKLRQEQLVLSAAAMQSGASLINFALASRQPRVIVVPDDWDEDLRDRLRLRWSIITRAILSETDWRERVASDSECVIAFGEFGRSSLVDELLDKAGQSRKVSESGPDVLIALLPQLRARKPWHMAVGVRERELAGSVAAEHVMRLFKQNAEFTREELGNLGEAKIGSH